MRQQAKYLLAFIITFLGFCVLAKGISRNKLKGKNIFVLLFALLPYRLNIQAVGWNCVNII